jgi:hypothetical protein
MAKVTMPLLSESASASVGKELTFSVRASGQQVRFQKKQKDRITPARILQRFKFKQGLTLWTSLPDNEKNYWKLCEKQGFVNV